MVSRPARKRTVVDQLRADNGVGWFALLHMTDDPYKVPLMFLRKGTDIWRVEYDTPAWRSAPLRSRDEAYTALRGRHIWRVRCDQPWLWRNLVPAHRLDLGVRDALAAVQALDTLVRLEWTDIDSGVDDD